MWIEKSEKEFYNDSSDVQGIRLYFAKGVHQEIKESCKDLCRWLRKKYFFPIRCKIVIKNCTYFTRDKNMESDKDSYADFYYKEDDNSILPEIWVAAGKTRRGSLENRKKRVLAHIVHELTHYFQWFFYQFEERTDKSLEIEANRWMYYLIEEYNRYLSDNHCKE